MIDRSQKASQGSKKNQKTKNPTAHSKFLLCPLEINDEACGVYTPPGDLDPVPTVLTITLKVVLEPTLKALRLELIVAVAEVNITLC